jgi:transcriptional regulator GlxA family with amidase domain
VTRVVFLLADRLHLLDLAGPAQAFSTAVEFGADYRMHYVGEREEIITTQGVPLRARLDWPEISADDLIVVPGWRPPQPPTHPGFSDPTLRHLQTHHRSGGTVASICAGAFALARAGLLDQRRCTTHHELQDDLARHYPRSTVVRDVLYVTDNRVVTSAGIASGIDLALHLLTLRHGPSFSARVARAMVVYARRNGDEQQAGAMLRYRGHMSDVVHRVQDIIDARFTQRLPLSELATAGGVSERTLTRAFARAAGLTPLRYQQLLRTEHANQLIEQGVTVEAAARSVGFDDARMLRRLRSRDR